MDNSVEVSDNLSKAEMPNRQGPATSELPNKGPSPHSDIRMSPYYY